MWVAQGTVNFVKTDGTKAGPVTSDGTGPLHVFRTFSDPAGSLGLDGDELTEIMNFIPMANQKTKSLRDKMARGVALTTAEQDYLHRIKEVPSVIKLALVEPPPAPKMGPAPVIKPAPVATTLPAKTPAPTHKAGPDSIVVHSNGIIKFEGAMMGLAEFQTKLKAAVLAKPDQAFVIKAGKKVAYDKIQQVLDSCRDANVAHVTAPPPPPAPAAAASGTQTLNLPAPNLLLHPSTNSLSTDAPPVPPSSPSAVPVTNAPTIPAGP